MPQPRVGEVYRLLQYQDGHVVLDGSLGPPHEEVPVDFGLPVLCLGGEGSCLVLIRDIMLAWCSKLLERIIKFFVM